MRLKTSKDSIILPDFMSRMTRDGIDLYEVEGGGYEMEENEIAIDLFCGAGGTSEGIRQAIGESPMFALNHNADAIGVHDANHPDTIHLLSDVFAMDPAKHVPEGKRIGLLTASPSCVHFSTARGGKPLDREIRDQAWVVANWCEHPDERFNPRVVVVENVREFLTWAPLNANNKIDKRCIDKNGLGSTFKEWRDRLVRAGYQFEFKILNAADFGVATKRRRLLMVARKDGLPIRFPVPTHGPRNSLEVQAGRLKAYGTAAEHIDFTIQCNPIFMYAEDAKRVGAVRPLAPNTLKRVAAGVEKFVIESAEPYIIPYYGAKAGERFRGKPVSEPLPTQTTENRFALVSPVISPVTHTGPGRYYEMEGQLPTLTCARRGELALITTICAMGDQKAAAVIPMRKECGPVSLHDPIPAFATHSQMALAVATFNGGGVHKDAIVSEIFAVDDPTFCIPFIAGAGGGEYAGKPRSAGSPFNTITCHSRQAWVMPSLIRVNHGDVDKNGKRRGRSNHDLMEPLPTQPTSNEFALVSPMMVSTEDSQGRQFAAASMVQTGYGERVGQSPRCLDIREPVGTLVAGGGKHAVVEASMVRTGPDSRVAFITNNNTNRKATSANDPVPTMTTGNQQIVTQAAMKALHIGQENFDDAGHDPAEPFSTMTLSPHHSVVTTGLVAGHMAQQNADNVGHPMDEPMSTMTTKVCHQNFVASHLMTLRQNTFGQSVDEPMSALCAAGNHHAEVRTSLVKYYGGDDRTQTQGTTMARSGFSVVDVPIDDLGLTEEQRYEAWWTARFLEIYGTKSQGNPDTAHLDGPRPSVIGRPGAILWTIEMRMLVPKEAFSASSFPKGYNFETRADGKKVSKTSQMALVGNAVPPGLAKAIVGANCKPRPSVSERMRLAA